MNNNEVKITNKEYLRLNSYVHRYRILVEYILRFVIDSLDEHTPNMTDEEKINIVVAELTKMKLPFHWSTSSYKYLFEIRADIEEPCDLRVSFKRRTI